ncbi:NitT/TauT family transport system permease protein [Rhizobium sp. PP-F2F-G38]|uniref:ABC transporter permease n=1 Tax=Rhizobium sp. PP-CC-3G-465 TaxID=2135648 RepID=UPI000D891726|nr:NitT/TauT family transport system permease protein [Rhizobium sp. PP-WC-1G-195]PYE94912.1 NitT/TauT family transport system permease protein [Rhizobium sp. PP-F2F-G38]TCP82104.1 NitT/TauT family transport system permease protein [Rhizobium sp. PP-CC-2G-626]TCQ25908.1 NitT/TauT family transport system permease protein [Rhizobium sp. PP-CC-3G-465]
MKTIVDRTQPSAAPARVVRGEGGIFRNARTRRAVLIALQLAIVFGGLLYWEIGARTGFISRFLFASPSMVLEVLVQRLQSGELLNDIWVTTMETTIGFAVGAIGGSILGLMLWYSKFISDLAAPFIAAIGSIPVLAIAPITIIWFGTELLSKIMIVAFSCVVVSLTTSYRGAQRTDPDLINLMRSFNASRTAIFTKLVIPSAMTWVVSGLKLNVGFALIGAIVAEYISSEAGVGHMILLGSSNFGMNIVLAGVSLVMLMMLVFNALITLLERFILSWERK